MKAVYGLAFVLVLIIAFVALRPQKSSVEIYGCVTQEQTPMGTKLKAYQPNSALRWDDKCPSGIGWTAK